MFTDAKPAGLVQAEHNAHTPEFITCPSLLVFKPHRLPGYA